MSKVKPEIDNPFMPAMSPVCRVANLFLVWSTAAAGLIAVGLAFARAYL